MTLTYGFIVAAWLAFPPNKNLPWLAFPTVSACTQALTVLQKELPENYYYKHAVCIKTGIKNGGEDGR
jgi:hypothetical protein